mmetsp:Transcript_6167/g.15626  ORF Transcript_6167/g.15626 Transcript_6167/m.15626 type:complete len:483 (+) Transcript_6167:69-1517(+)
MTRRAQHSRLALFPRGRRCLTALLLAALAVSGPSSVVPRAHRSRAPSTNQGRLVLGSAEVEELVSGARGRYASRPTVTPDLLTPLSPFPSGREDAACAAGSTPCGLWLESLGSASGAVCKDICLDIEYLPDQLPGEPPHRTAADAARLQRMLKASQFPRQCAPVRLHPLTGPKAGLGITLHYAAHSLLVALATGATYIPHRQSLELWTTKRLCGGQRSLHCFFQPLSHCHIPEVGIGKGASEWQLDAEIEAQALGLGKSGIRDDVQIEPFAPRGSVWALSQALRFLWQPQAWLQRAVERARASMPPSTGPILGVHVRHGDACAAGRECYTWGQYRQAALRMKAKYGVARIMLATDSQEIVQQCQEDPEFKCHAVTHNRSSLAPRVGAHAGGSFGMSEGAGKKQPKSRHYIENRIRKGELDGGQLAVAALVDLALLGECMMFVGTFSSSFSRMALLLMHGRTGSPVPFISLDSAWGRRDGGII